MINKISTKKLSLALKNPNYTIIDIRPIDAYNGWKLNGENRSGHIKGAKALPYSWTNYMDWMDIVRSKEIDKKDNIVIYGYNSEKIEKTAKLFKKIGYENLLTYFDFVSEWTTDDKLPMDYLKRYDRLVHPQWLKDVIDGKKVENFDNDKFVIVHSHYRNYADYGLGHIPRAIEIDTLLLESPVTWNRRSPIDLKVALESKGISADTSVILYGRFGAPDNNDAFPGSSAGHLGAIRSAAIMMYAGVKDVRILNGGLLSWEKAGFDIETKANYPKRVYDFGTDVPANPWVFIDIDEAKEYIKSNNKELVSVRSWAEYIGDVSGYNYIKKKGRIPGSVFGNCGTDAYHMENYRNVDHTTREFHEVEQQLREAGLTPDKQLAFYCGTGWRGSEAFFNAFLMGYSNVSVFDGGWFEWSNDPNNPFETGDPK